MNAAKLPVFLPESSAAPWPDESDFRPPGWRGKLSPVQVILRLAEVEEERKAPGGWDSDKLAKEAGRLRELVKILRQSWCTPEYVWRLAEMLLGPPEVDPFWNPWGCTHLLWSGVRLLDGVQGRDGFDLSQWGRVPPQSVALGQTVTDRGRTAYVNGTHDDAGKYVSLSARAHAAGHRVAAAIALDGCKWFAGATECAGQNADDTPKMVHSDAASCDVLAIPEGGRMAFVPPPGVKASSPSKGYGVALWGVPELVMLELWPDWTGGAVRVEVAGKRWTLWRGCGDAGQPVRTLTLGKSAAT